MNTVNEYVYDISTFIFNVSVGVDICNLNVQDFQLVLAIQKQLMLLDIANWYFTSHYSHYKYFCNCKHNGL